MKTLKRWFKQLRIKVIPNNFTIESRVLPGFPKWDIDDKSIWNIIDRNKDLQLLCGDKRPASCIGTVFKCSHRVKKQTSGEGYPTWSPITLTITVL